MKKYIFALFLSLIFSGAALADSASYSSTNAGGTSWTRPFADGTCCSGLGPVLLHEEQFTVSSDDVCSISSVQSGYDGYLFVYTDTFDPLNQTVNFLAGDDDGSGGIGTSDIENVSLQANTTYRVVTTGFENGEVGDFTNTITCPTAQVRLGPPPVAVTPVPTLGEWALILLAALIGLTTYSHLTRRKLFR